MARCEAAALVYLALPTVVFVAGWIVAPLGPAAAVAVLASIVALLLGQRGRWLQGLGALWIPVAAIAALWCVLAGIGHYVYANPDWVVRDAVLLDLVRDPWPVRYDVGQGPIVLRAPIGYFLPAAVVGKLSDLTTAEHALLAWTVCGVVLTFGLMLRDRPPLKAALIRIAIFIAFSGLDIVGTIAHYNPHALGDHLEWWAVLFQYSSQTTQLFWVPNHALPGWLAIAWIAGRHARRMAPTPAILFVLFAPLWSPLTAIGLLPIVAIALLERFAAEPRIAGRAALDWRMLVPLVVCVALVYPYLVAGSDRVASGLTADIPWVGEDIVPRYIEFVLFEFAGIAAVLLLRRRDDLRLWIATGVLLMLPAFRFGPYNDLAMRASIPALTLYAIELGRWLSTPHAFARERRGASIALVLLAVGAVTPTMEFARGFIESPWPMSRTKAVVDVTRGTHYLAPQDQPWMRRFLRP